MEGLEQKQLTRMDAPGYWMSVFMRFRHATADRAVTSSKACRLYGAVLPVMRDRDLGNEASLEDAPRLRWSWLCRAVLRSLLGRTRRYYSVIGAGSHFQPAHSIHSLVNRACLVVPRHPGCPPQRRYLYWSFISIPSALNGITSHPPPSP